MFEDQKEDKELGLHKGWIVAFVVIAAIILVVGFRMLNKGGSKIAQASAADLANADPVKDLKIERAKMDKDAMGTTAVWSVTLVNKSDKYTYYNIEYQTDYIAADNHLLVQNKGTMQASVGPNGEDTKEIRDTAYPAGVAWYKFKVTGAKAKIVY